MDKICRICNLTKPLAEFHKDRSKPDGLNSYCKPCTIERQKERMARPVAKPRFIVPEGMRRCGGCKETKPVTEFFASKARFDGLQVLCKVCQRERHEAWRVTNMEKARVHTKVWRDRNPDHAHDHWLKSRYGLPVGGYARLLADQGGGCAICKTADPGGRGGRSGRFHVDHCHDTGAVRGLLCHHCNVGIGNLRHDPDILRAAITYVTAARGK